MLSSVPGSRVFTKGIPLRPYNPSLVYACSVWVYRVQGETEGDFRRGDKWYAIRILERATGKLELFG
jgi:hypothetical protein